MCTNVCELQKVAKHLIYISHNLSAWMHSPSDFFPLQICFSYLQLLLVEIQKNYDKLIKNHVMRMMYKRLLN